MGRHLALHLGGALAAVTLACVIPLIVASLGAWGWRLPLALLALAVPIALLVFGVKVVRWMRAPIAFRTPLTVGQQRSLPSLAHARTGAPHTAAEALARALVDGALWRPLARATPSAHRLAPALGHGLVRSLWLLAMLFHGALAVTLLGHLRLLLPAPPPLLAQLENLDTLSQAALPRLHTSSVLLLLALLLLLGRRLAVPRLRYISLAADYLPLCLLAAIATTGMLMRHAATTDLVSFKQALTGLGAGTAQLPGRPDGVLVTHVFLVGVLLVYVPASKLMHGLAVWLSPTLTLANHTRQRRHLDPNNPRVEVHAYADYEKAFRGPMIEAGLPVEPE